MGAGSDYIARTSHGSTLSRLVHSVVCDVVGDRESAWKLYREALVSDYEDVQGGTTGEGIHMGVMSGTVWSAMTAFGGLSLRGAHPAINPHLPAQWTRLAFRFGFRGAVYHCEISASEVSLRVEGAAAGEVEVEIFGEVRKVRSGECVRVTARKAA